MKKYIILMLCFMFCLTACGKADEDNMEYQAEKENNNEVQYSEDVSDVSDFDEEIVMPNGDEVVE